MAGHEVKRTRASSVILGIGILGLLAMAGTHLSRRLTARAAAGPDAILQTATPTPTFTPTATATSVPPTPTFTPTPTPTATVIGTPPPVGEPPDLTYALYVPLVLHQGPAVQPFATRTTIARASR